MTSIKNAWRTLAMAGTAAAFALTASPAFASKPPPDVNPPTIHGFCSLGNTCTDNGTNTPTSVNPPVFSFASSGGSATGTLFIDILVPDNFAIPGPFTISPFTNSGTLSGTATLYDANGAAPGTPAWTSGDLKTYLGGLDASPNNPIGAFLPATQTFQSSATGYYVFTADLGSTTLLGTGGVGGAGQDNYLMTLGQSVPTGSYIVGFLEQTDDYGATANSGAILETHPALPEPSTWAMMLFGFGAAGIAIRRSRRKSQLLSQLA